VLAGDWIDPRLASGPASCGKVLGVVRGWFACAYAPSRAGVSAVSPPAACGVTGGVPHPHCANDRSKYRPGRREPGVWRRWGCSRSPLISVRRSLRRFLNLVKLIAVPGLRMIQRPARVVDRRRDLAAPGQVSGREGISDQPPWPPTPIIGRVTGCRARERIGPPRVD
jgi:hypothetical protein